MKHENIQSKSQPIWALIGQMIADGAKELQDDSAKMLARLLIEEALDELEEREA